MRANKVILVLFIFGIFLTLSSAEILAQNSKPSAQISLLKEDKSSPFKEGKTVIVEVRYDGLDGDFEEYDDYVGKPIYESDFRRDLREQRSSISEEEPFRSEKVEKVIKFLKEWLAGQGYLKANVVALGEKLPNNKMKLIFSVERGIPVLVSEIRFTGLKNITNDELVEDFRKCLGSRRPIFDRRLYDYCAQKNSRSLMFSHGFWEAKIQSVSPRFVKENYLVTIAVEEGIRYRIGEIKIEGVKAFSEKEILEIIGQKAGDVADGKGLQDFVYNRLKTAYGEKGYVQYNAEFEPTFSEPPSEGLDGNVDVLITIDEGRKFSIRKITFSGVEKDDEKMLRDDFQLKEGDIYIPSKLEASIKNINKMNLFDPVDKDMNVGFKTDEEAGTLDLVIILRKPDE